MSEIEKEIKKEVETLHQKEAKLFRKWTPELTIITVISVILILGVVAYSGLAVNDLKAQLNAAKSTGGVIVNPAASADQCVFSCQANSRLKLGIEPITSSTACKTAGKIKVYAFYSPTCGYCEAQRPILDEMKQKYGDKLDLSYICTNLHQGDDAICQKNEGNKYLPVEQSQELLQKYESIVLDAGGTPGLIINCEYLRSGTYAIIDQNKGTNNEKEDLTALFDLLLAK